MSQFLASDLAKKKIETLVNKLASLRFEQEQKLAGEYLFCDYKTDNAIPGKDAGWIPLEETPHFDGVDAHFWLHFHFEIPVIPENKEIRFCLLTGRENVWSCMNPQGMIFVDGKNVQALDTKHIWYPLESGRSYDMYIYMYTGMVGGEFTAKGVLQTVDKTVEKLYYDIKVPFETLELLPEGSRDYLKTENALDRAVMLLDLRNVGSENYYHSVAAACGFLQEEYYQKICGGEAPTISCIGHTHIDVAWKWTVAQTKEKAQRSFATVLALMDRYPSYKFMSSQPQLYQHVKENDPELYERIKQRVREGRWEVDGAMWLEPDCNLISGESMVRQLLYGKRFMREEFGVESRMLWLPDVFGYSGALPQILKKAGVDRFFTTKLKWNDTNTMPHDTFIWEGIDGSEVFVNMRAEYNGVIDSRGIYRSYERNQDKKLTDQVLLPFGYGDGGGGATAEMLENYERLKYGLPGMPAVKIEKSGEFFDRLEKEFHEKTELLRDEPRWVGELYFELHRGTYTSIAKNKKNNRKSELLYQEAETLSVLDKLLCGGAYPADLFHKNQINILLNQFHDILPGSSIKEVYDDTDVEYKRILSEGRSIADDKLRRIAAELQTKGGVFVYNPAPFPVSDYVMVEDKRVYAQDIPAHGWRVVSAEESQMQIIVCDTCIENNLLRVSFNDKYEIVSVYDKQANREVVLSGGSCNRFEAFEDYPYAYDAWEISRYYKQKKWAVDTVNKVELLCDGIAVERTYSNSKIWQKIRLKENSKRIDFETKIDWHEDHTLLKTAFDVDIHSPYATYETQFGHVQRPTHANTSWDQAKFEVCGHKWADLSESGYGVSLLNDCKYGHSTEKNTMTLSLLKAATFPNPEADRGMHEFVYAMYPHEGDFREGGSIQESYRLNMPLEAFTVEENNGILPEAYGTVTSDQENVVVETIKKAEDSDAVIVRMYEAYNRKCTAHISFGFEVEKAFICNLMEEDDKELELTNHTVTIPVRNFEIVTLKLEVKQ